MKNLPWSPSANGLEEASFPLHRGLPGGYWISVLQCLLTVQALTHQAQGQELRHEQAEEVGGGSCTEMLVCVLSANEEHLGPVSASQSSPLSNCSTSKLRLINCLAVSGFKDPRCAVKLMAALSPLNLTPKQSLENIPDPSSPVIPVYGGSVASFGWIPVHNLVHSVSCSVCMCLCRHVYKNNHRHMCSDQKPS